MALSFENKIKQARKANNTTVDVEALITSWAEAEDGYEHLSTMTTRELLSIRGYLHTKMGVSTDYVNGNTSPKRIVHIVHKALVSAFG